MHLYWSKFLPVWLATQLLVLLKSHKKYRNVDLSSLPLEVSKTCAQNLLVFRGFLKYLEFVDRSPLTRFLGERANCNKVTKGKLSDAENAY